MPSDITDLMTDTAEGAEPSNQASRSQEVSVARNGANEVEDRRNGNATSNADAEIAASASKVRFAPGGNENSTQAAPLCAKEGSDSRNEMYAVPPLVAAMCLSLFLDSLGFTSHLQVIRDYGYGDISSRDLEKSVVEFL